MLTWYLIGLGLGFFLGFGAGLRFAAFCIYRGWSPAFMVRPEQQATPE